MESSEHPFPKKEKKYIRNNQKLELSGVIELRIGIKHDERAYWLDTSGYILSLAPLVRNPSNLPVVSDSRAIEISPSESNGLW